MAGEKIKKKKRSKRQGGEKPTNDVKNKSSQVKTRAAMIWQIGKGREKGDEGVGGRAMGMLTTACCVKYVRKMQNIRDTCL